MEDFLQLRVLEKRKEAPGVVTLILASESGQVDYKPGQFLTLVFSDLGPSEIRRSYSLSSTPHLDNFLALTVKQQANGVVSRYLVEKIKPGELLQSLTPAGQFTLDPQSTFSRDVFFFAGGSGVTPVFPILKTLLQKEPQSRLHLLLANRNEKHIIFRETFQSLAREYPDQWHCMHLLSNLHEEVNLSEGRHLPVKKRWGRLSNALVEDWVNKNLTYRKEDAEFFVCGPSGLMLKTSMCLAYMGFAKERIHREVFDIVAPFRPPASRYQNSELTLHWKGSTHQIPLLAGQTILEAAEAAGLPLPYSCRSGICTTCNAQCLSGKAEMHTPDGTIDTDILHGNLLTCVGYPLTEKLVLSMDFGP